MPLDPDIWLLTPKFRTPSMTPPTGDDGTKHHGRRDKLRRSRGVQSYTLNPESLSLNPKP